MKFLASCLFELALALPILSNGIQNPIIPGFHPDPSVCRVGDTFYLVNSSFQYFPGVPIFQSKDMMNWEQIGNVLDRESQIPLKGASSWLGIYAPTIRYHDGVFYMITTNVGNGGNFMVTATNPSGPWSEPIWLKQQGIDPSLYFEDGKCYMVSNPDNTITLCEINPSTGEQLTESKPLWQGTGGRYPEGPHIYKKDGWYYLLISEGGTELAHRLTMARSRNIDGPYVANPDNPLLTHCSLAGQGSQVQGTGHGDLVQGADGKWWMVFLAYRNYGGSYHHLGRETFLAPVEWETGAWPVVNGGNPIEYEEPSVKDEEMANAIGSQTNKPLSFSNHPSFPWIYIQNPIMGNYVREGNTLRLKPHGTLAENDRPTFYGIRQESANMQVETELSAWDHHVKAGLSVYQIQDGFVNFYVEGKNVTVWMRLKSINYPVARATLPEGAKRVRLRIKGSEEHYTFSCSADGGAFVTLCDVNCSLLSTEVAGGFTGVVLGMFAEGEAQDGWAEFTGFSMLNF